MKLPFAILLQISVANPEEWSECLHSRIIQMLPACRLIHRQSARRGGRSGVGTALTTQRMWIDIG